MANPQDIANNPAFTPSATALQLTPAPITGELIPPTPVGVIRNISQTVQEREIIKTAPDVVVFIDGLPYLINEYVNSSGGNQSTLVNFNDHVTSFTASYDTDALVPDCSFTLQVPNYQKYLYQMPGGNNLLQTMAQIQVYAKSYFPAGGTGGDTVYRRVFKGVTSYIGYNDNGRILEISVQCHGILHLLEKMQVNIHPSVNTSLHTGAQQTIWQSKYGAGDPFSVLRQVFLDALRSDGFQFGSLDNQSMLANGKGTNPFWQAVRLGYMAKWQAILTNMTKDVHIYGPNKDNLGDNVGMKKSQVQGQKGKNKQSDAVSKHLPQSEADLVAEYQTYYGNISTYFPFKNITALSLPNSVIVNRLDIIREVVGKMDYEAYQDVDGKVIIKPPVYNLDVVNVGTRTSQTQTNPNSSHNSFTNPATAIYETNNPFVIYLSEILTEHENEDQSAIRRTRTTVCGNVSKSLVINYENILSTAVGEYIDVTKIAKFGLREEPLYQVPWLSPDPYILFAHAAAETARANRGYRTYTFTIPMRPELKLGFPVYIPHKDMYAYIKTISLNFSIGGQATMSVTCDSVRRRVLINTEQTTGSGNAVNTHVLYTPAPNLVYQWTQTTTTTQTNADILAAQKASLTHAGTISGVSNSGPNPTDPRGVSQTLTTPINNPDGTLFQPSPDELKVYSYQSQVLGTHLGNQFNTPTSTYVIKNDGDGQQGTIDPATKHGYFCINQTQPQSRPADTSYIRTLTGDPKTHANSVIPFTDDKGYELISPFPWGRWVDLNTAIKEFTEQGWVKRPTDVNGNDSLQDLRILQNTDAFLFAGLGTPSATGDAASQLINALNQQASLVGGLSGTYTPQTSAASSAKGTPKQKTATNATDGGVQQSISQPDATVIVLKYSPSLAATTGVVSLLNAAQPENKFAQQLLMNTQNATQQLVDVLVSGEVAPSPTVQEALLVANTPQQVPSNVQLLNATNLNRANQ